MDILLDISRKLPQGKLEKIALGSHWVAVVVQTELGRACGLASTPTKSFLPDEKVHAQMDAWLGRNANQLLDTFIPADDLLLRGVALATINALLPKDGYENWPEVNASEAIMQRGRGKDVVLVGHFPFVPELRENVGKLSVLELNPREGDLPASAAPQIIPQADILAVTSMAFVNKTIDGLLVLCRPETYVIVIGPSTPLSASLFDRGVNMLCGSIVENIDGVVERVLAGDGFRQIKKVGVRLAALTEDS
jgi:uncharacterized protein (DUF4213/DUF364 family)